MKKVLERGQISKLHSSFSNWASYKPDNCQKIVQFLLKTRHLSGVRIWSKNRDFQGSTSTLKSPEGVVTLSLNQTLSRWSVFFFKLYWISFTQCWLRIHFWSNCVKPWHHPVVTDLYEKHRSKTERFKNSEKLIHMKFYCLRKETQKKLLLWFFLFALCLTWSFFYVRRLYTSESCVFNKSRNQKLCSMGETTQFLLLKCVHCWTFVATTDDKMEFLQQRLITGLQKMMFLN